MSGRFLSKVDMAEAKFALEMFELAVKRKISHNCITLYVGAGKKAASSFVRCVMKKIGKNHDLDSTRNRRKPDDGNLHLFGRA